MFQKLRRTRINKRSGDNSKSSTSVRKETKKQSQSGIFRRTMKEDTPSLQLAPTLTLSQDDEDDHAPSSSSSYNNLSAFGPESPKVQQISSYIFTAEELMTNELNRVRALAEKQSEIVKLQQVHAELTQVLAAKEAELICTQLELEAKDNELAECYQELTEKDDELVETKMELYDTTDKLHEVSNVLMKCQAKLHEKVSNVWFW